MEIILFKEGINGSLCWYRERRENRKKKVSKVVGYINLLHVSLLICIYEVFRD